MSHKIDFTTLTPGGWVTLNSTYGVYYRKTGNIVEFRVSNYDETGLAMSSITIPIGTLPVGFRPNTSIRFPIWGHRTESPAATCFSMAINSDGGTAFTLWGGTGTFQQYGGYVSFCV